MTFHGLRFNVFLRAVPCCGQCHVVHSTAPLGVGAPFLRAHALGSFALFRATPYI